MRISNAYYTCGIRRKKLKGYLKSIEKDKAEKGLQLVILPVYGKDLLEIYDYGKLLDIAKKAELNGILVVGIAKDYDCACDLVTEIIQDVYDTTGEAMDVRAYFDHSSDGEICVPVHTPEEEEIPEGS